MSTPVLTGSTSTTAKQAPRAARNFPQTYSPGRSGVEWSRSPILVSASRISGMPAAIATRNEIMKKPISP